MFHIQELKNEVTKLLPNSSFLDFLEATPSRAPEHSKIWNRIFNDNGKWLDYAVTHHNVQPVLLCSDFKKRNPYIILCIMDYGGDLCYDEENFKKSLRPYKKDKNTGLLKFKRTSIKQTSGKRKSRWRGLTLRVFGMYSEVAYTSDWESHRLISQKTEDTLGLQYCFWTDTDRKIQTVQRNEIRGIDGTVTRIKDLAPIFTVNLPICPDKGPIEIVFAWGNIKVVEPHQSNNFRNYYGVELVDYWTFTFPHYKENRYRIKDWTRVHEQDAIVEGRRSAKGVSNEI
ncbi:hypothetical protein BU24DRAFT_408426 [Aaosphaeria arxii CBS 175.79]|uniref:Uncharacterized protein n=1 Tax=Aaosphaeria arxii CBS 175.79 TaxID=1450172 RepID=A0A6A5Y019_9PLEO|nr:uncharacterized protein BU24DRAFT_408426 [Aaosphaeria arxii CBS 175.79]KAF2018523.1 hypothetical protein BU24DRAFT_408426 [Aaosphaeria arxii CBS 175.79]